MKLFLSALALVFASAAQATPAVGDLVNFKGTWGTETVEQSISFTAFDQATSQFTVLTTTTVGAKAPESSTEQVAAADTATDAALQDILTNCVQYGGEAVSVTVAAGTFPTCKAPLQSGGYIYYGVVPFGVIRMEAIVEAKPLIMDLQGFTRGL